MPDGHKPAASRDDIQIIEELERKTAVLKIAERTITSNPKTTASFVISGKLIGPVG